MTDQLFIFALVYGFIRLSINFIPYQSIKKGTSSSWKYFDKNNVDFDILKTVSFLQSLIYRDSNWVLSLDVTNCPMLQLLQLPNETARCRNDCYIELWYRLCCSQHVIAVSFLNSLIRNDSNWVISLNVTRNSCNRPRRQQDVEMTATLDSGIDCVALNIVIVVSFLNSLIRSDGNSVISLNVTRNSCNHPRRQQDAEMTASLESGMDWVALKIVFVLSSSVSSLICCGGSCNIKAFAQSAATVQKWLLHQIFFRL